ncbi:MAG: SMP-30/gluconolactonase/LRE family protein [Candidatus Omnitrophica bacterium]|nr:SMP-30/gluconolactonase/LRE family protein [Candidatus Omnitrophota bacterium]
MSRSIVWRNLCVAGILVFVGGESFSGVVADGAELQKIGGGYSFTEGPAADSEGNVYFTDQPNDRILKWSVSNGTVSTYMENTGRSNGLYFDNKGNLLACADLDNQLWLIKPDKSVEVLVKDFEGKRLNGPNDLWIDKRDGVYFTDPFYKRNYWERTEMEIETQDAYYLSPDRTTLERVATGFVKPNGIVGTKNGKFLYIVDIGDKKTYRYRINKLNGELYDRQLFVEMGSDGMTIDHKGNVYLTGEGVTIFNKKGEKIGHIDVPERWTANICFGGKEQKKLFVTAMGSLYTLDMKVRGVR